MTAAPTSATRLIALLGDPVAHSLSPVFQNAAFRAAQVDGVYLALRCAPGELPGLLSGLALAGGGGNVTLPHKELAARTVARRTGAVEATGACNTFWREGGEVWGDNTDVAGFSAAVEALLGAPPAGARVLLLGAGGAARAALASLGAAGAREVVVSNRSPGRAAALVERFASSRARLSVAPSPAPPAGEPFDLVVNSTSLGLRASDPLPLPLDGSPPFRAALDLVYSPGETAWVRELRARGIPAADGAEMLLRQGAAAFERWWGREAPLEAMRTALAAARRG